VNELLELTGLINFYSIHKVQRYRNVLMDMTGNFLFRLTIIILTLVIAFISSVFLEHFQRYHLLINRNDVQTTFPQVQCLWLINKKKRQSLFRCRLKTFFQVLQPAVPPKGQVSLALIIIIIIIIIIIMQDALRRLERVFSVAMVFVKR